MIIIPVTDTEDEPGFEKYCAAIIRTCLDEIQPQTVTAVESHRDPFRTVFVSVIKPDQK